MQQFADVAGRRASGQENVISGHAHCNITSYDHRGDGGYLSKHSVGIYSGRLDGPWQVRSSAAEQAEAGRAGDVAVAEIAMGPARIESYAAVYAKGERSGGYIVGRLDADNRRFLAVMEPGSGAALALLFGPDPIGHPVTVRHADGLNSFTCSA